MVLLTWVAPMVTKDRAKREKDLEEAKPKLDEMLRRIARFQRKKKRKPVQKLRGWVLTSHLLPKHRA